MNDIYECLPGDEHWNECVSLIFNFVSFSYSAKAESATGQLKQMQDRWEMARKWLCFSSCFFFFAAVLRVDQFETHLTAAELLSKHGQARPLAFFLSLPKRITASSAADSSSQLEAIKASSLCRIVYLLIACSRCPFPLDRMSRNSERNVTQSTAQQTTIKRIWMGAITGWSAWTAIKSKGIVSRFESWLCSIAGVLVCIWRRLLSHIRWGLNQLCEVFACSRHSLRFPPAQSILAAGQFTLAKRLLSLLAGVHSADQQLTASASPSPSTGSSSQAQTPNYSQASPQPSSSSSTSQQDSKAFTFRSALNQSISLSKRFLDNAQTLTAFGKQPSSVPSSSSSSSLNASLSSGQQQQQQSSASLVLHAPRLPLAVCEAAVIRVAREFFNSAPRCEFLSNRTNVLISLLISSDHISLAMAEDCLAILPLTASTASSHADSIEQQSDSSNNSTNGELSTPELTRQWRREQELLGVQCDLIDWRACELMC